MGMLNKKIGFFGQVLSRVPFTYNFILKSCVGNSFKSLLDVGCGNGLPMEIINKGKIFYTVGVDIYEPYLKECRKKGLYDKLIKADVRKLSFNKKNI